MTELHEPVPESLLARFVPMSALGESYLKELAQHARLITLDAGDALTAELAGVESIVYLVEGAVCFSGAGQPDAYVRATDPGARFALQGAETSGREAHAVEPSRLLRVERAKVSTLLIWAEASSKPTRTRDEQRLRQDLTTLLMHSRLFERIPPGNIERIGELIEPIRLKAGEVVVRQGEPGDYYYIVEEGRCEVLHEAQDGGQPVRLARLEAGESFGEEALLTDGVRNATVRMETDGIVMRLTRKYFVDLISTPLVSDVDHERAEDLIATGARWVDVRLAEEFERDGLDGAINIPLGQLRSRARELPAGGSYVTYCNSGRRAQAGAFLLSQRGLHTVCLRDGIAVRRPVPRGLDGEGESLTALRAALVEVDAELERALHDKAEADAARDVEQRLLAPSEAEAAAAARLEALRAQSNRASEVLRAAMDRKRELESRVRDVEAREVSHRRAAEEQCELMRAEAEQRLEAEKQRLSERYRKASEQLSAIEQARRDAEARFEQERARIERELEEERARMEAEAARIRETMESARREAEARAHGIRNEYVTQEQQVRRQTEEGLRAERGRLEEEFALSVAAQERARRALDHAESERVRAEHENERLRRDADAELARRRARETAAREAEVERLRQASEEARARLDHAQSDLEKARRNKDAYSRTLSREPGKADPEREATMRHELDTFEQALASADDAVAQARQAHADATRAQTIAEQTAAEADVRADELRLKLYEEMEEWISDEEERSREELEVAERYARQIDRIQAEKEKRRQADLEATQSMFSDIAQMLEGKAVDDSITELMRSRIAAEEKARLVQRARREAREQLERARAAAADKSDPD